MFVSHKSNVTLLVASSLTKLMIMLSLYDLDLYTGVKGRLNYFDKYLLLN